MQIEKQRLLLLVKAVLRFNLYNAEFELIYRNASHFYQRIILICTFIICYTTSNTSKQRTFS